MQRPIDDLIEPSSSEALLSGYQQIYENFRWEEEEKKLLRKDGLMNLSVLCLEGIGQQRPLYRKAFEFVQSKDGRLQHQGIDASELEELTRRLAAGLRSGVGVEKGDPVAIYLPAGRELVLSLLALTYMGAIASPIIDIFRIEPLRSRLANLRPKVLITSAEMIEEMDFESLDFLKVLVLADDGSAGSLPAGISPVQMSKLFDGPKADPQFVDPGHPFTIHYTPGTLGAPKGIIHAHRSAAGYYHTARWVLNLGPSSVLWCTAHPGWIVGSVYGIFAPLLCGATSIIFRGEPDMRALREMRPDTLYTIPSIINGLVTGTRERMQDVDLSSVKLIAAAGERLPASTVKEMRSIHGLSVLDTWWTTETGMITIANFPSTPVKAGSIGLPVPGMRPLVIDEKGSPLPPNALGLLAVEGTWPAMLQGVWGDEEAFHGYFQQSRFVTSDYAYRDEDGYFWFQGRAEEFIRRGGGKLSPVEIEDVLHRHPAVEEVAVIGIPRAGKEILKAFVVLTPGFEMSDEVSGSLREWVGENMGAYAVPDEFKFLDALPKTRIGKVLKRTLRAMEMNLPQEQV